MLDTAESRIKMNRVWAMPSADTLSIPPFRQLVKKYLHTSKVSVDPFARNCTWATYTNDLNPDTAAEYHLEADEFLKLLVANGVQADMVIFDPPYSLTQVSRSYQDIGLKFKGSENPTGGFPAVRRAIANILQAGGICLSFGWNSCGMGLSLGFEIEEILVVCHGGNRNDTICTVERKLEDRRQSLLP
jgi:hypothetical protein